LVIPDEIYIADKPDFFLYVLVIYLSLLLKMKKKTRVPYGKSVFFFYYQNHSIHFVSHNISGNGIYLQITAKWNILRQREVRVVCLIIIC